MSNLPGDFSSGESTLKNAYRAAAQATLSLHPKLKKWTSFWSLSGDWLEVPLTYSKLGLSVNIIFFWTIKKWFEKMLEIVFATLGLRGTS